MPKFINENTLVIVLSFLEIEALEVKVAQEANSEIACITHGGKLAEIAKALQPFNFTSIFSRAMLTYSVIQQLFLFNHYGFINVILSRPKQQLPF